MWPKMELNRPLLRAGELQDAEEMDAEDDGAPPSYPGALCFASLLIFYRVNTRERPDTRLVHVFED